MATKKEIEPVETVKPKPANSKRYDLDWSAVEQEYIQTNISIDVLAKKINRHPNIVGKRSSEGDWVNKRKEHRARIAALAGEQHIQKTAESLSEARDIVVEVNLEILRKARFYYRKHHARESSPSTLKTHDIRALTVTGRALMNIYAALGVKDEDNKANVELPLDLLGDVLRGSENPAEVHNESDSERDDRDQA